MSGVFPKETIKNTAEAVGIPNIKDGVASALAHDVEYRIHEIIQEAIKFMNHSKRTKLTGEDINNALRVRNVEPLYGFNSTNMHKFQRLTTNNIDLFYLEDDELDFDNLVSAPLPKVPQDVTFTAHWLAVDGVQPATLHNPLVGDLRMDTSNASETIEANSHSVNGVNNVDVKPLVKHALSKELQAYYLKIIEAVLNTDHDELQTQAFNSLQGDTALHQLLPYFVQFICEKVGENIKNIEVLKSAMRMAMALLQNKSLYLDPYLHQLIPAILTCLVAKRLGSNTRENHWAVRDLAADIIATIVKQYGSAYRTLQPRITKALLRAFLDTNKSLTTHYGAIVGLSALGREVIKILLLPNLKTYSGFLKAEQESPTYPKSNEATKCTEAIARALGKMRDDIMPGANRMRSKNSAFSEAQLREKIGDIFVTAVWNLYQDPADLLEEIYYNVIDT